MNSQFRNSNFGSILYIGIIVIIALGLVIISWYMFAGYKIGTFSEDTILGSVYLGGLREDDIDERIYNREDEWKDDETIVFELTYQGYSYEFDRNLFYFNLELSKTFLKDGQTNELIAQYQDTGDSSDRTLVLNEISNLAFLSDVKDNVDFERLVTDVLDDAGLMKTFSSKDVEDYLIDPSLSLVEISSIDISVPDGVDVDLMITGIQGVYGDEYIDLNSKELFDIIEELGASLNDSEMTILSSAMLELALETNFSIHEVHAKTDIGKDVDFNEYEFFGRNTQVNKVVDNSFSLYNPNESTYMFKVEKIDNDTAKLTLVGLPFVNTIEATKTQTSIAYISQYTDNDELLQVGRDGMIVVVTRVITDVNETIIYEREIIFEFYPPVTEITLEPIPE